jgi:aminodeoxychorismate synthase component I
MDRVPEVERVAEALWSRAPGGPMVWLDSARAHPVTGRWSVLAWDPWLTLTAAEGELTLRASDAAVRGAGDPLEALRAVLARYRTDRPGALPGEPPMGAGLMVLLGYELGGWIERLPAPKPAPPAMATPELVAMGMRATLVIDHAAEAAWLVAVDAHDAVAVQRRALAWLADLAADDGRSASSSSTMRANETHSDDTRATADAHGAASVHPTLTPAEFEAMVLRAQEFIAAGDIFQANLSHQFAGTWTGGDWALYRALRAVNPSPFACLVRAPEFSVVSCSPERLVRVQGGQVTTRPIAGTRPRGRGADEDVVNSLELVLSEKERAEHIMLVDLARNDLGRVCRPGSVHVDELMALEDYSHVIHLVSNVGGALADGRDAVDVIRAVFPGGTITGCPKVRAMEIIRDLEPVPRGLYTGSCGWIGFNGELDLNILIRTIVARGERVVFHAGAGIVADSQPDREYAETLAKAGAMLKALDAASLHATEARG